MTTKCAICKHAPRKWTWQPFGPDLTANWFTLLGSHTRGFPAIPVCQFCKVEVIQAGGPVEFTYKGTQYRQSGTSRPMPLTIETGKAKQYSLTWGIQIIIDNTVIVAIHDTREGPVRSQRAISIANAIIESGLAERLYFYGVIGMGIQLK